MKITGVEKVTRTFHYVSTDDRDWPLHRRWGPDNWEQLMGESWEAAYSREEDLERLFQEQQHEPVGL